MALPWVGTWIAWPWIEVDAGLPGSVLFDLGLVAAFGILHSALAGRAPRAVYTIVAGLSAFLFMAAWQPTGRILFSFIPGAIPSAIVSMVLYWGFLFAGFRSLSLVESPLEFAGMVVPDPKKTATLWTGGLYRYCRHPLYLLTLAAWVVTPMMSLDRAVFIAGMAAYLVFGIRREERRMIEKYGDVYRAYQATTPMLFPRKSPGTL
jgi:protein-S-isoprenylcysteine O-methyltransferase Ste14